MKSIFLFLFMLGAATVLAQQPSARFIDVSGTAELEAVPDEIFVAVTLRERYDGRVKVSVERQEDSLRNVLRRIGIRPQDVSLTNANADFVRVSWTSRDVLTRKDFEIKVRNADTLGMLFAALRDMTITDASISRVRHSRMDSLERDARVRAALDARTKAVYMTEALGAKLGAPLQVTEEPGRVQGSQRYYVEGVAMRSSITTVDRSMVGKEVDPYAIEFRKIRMVYQVGVRFAIE